MNANKSGIKNNRLLLAIAIILGIAIIGLVVGIVILNINGKGSGGGEGTYPQSMHTPELEEINAQAATLPKDEAKQLYLDAIANTSTRRSRSEARIEYGRYLYTVAEYSEMMNQFAQVEEDEIDDGYKILLYSAYRDYYTALGDQKTSDAFNAKIGEVVKNSNYAAGG
jgi:hypothetical protein